jgi:Family of unknown function (DUF6159)
VMVYEGLGPFLAIRRSGEVLKKTWGESLVRHFSFGIIQFFVAVPGIALILFGMFRADTLWFLIPVGLLWLIVTALLFSVVAVVFNTALYEYASTGRIPQGFEGPTLKAAFVQAQPARV